MPISEVRLRALSKAQIERLLDQIDRLKARYVKDQLKIMRRFIPDITESDLEEQESVIEEKKPKAKKKHGLDISMSSDSESESDEE